MARISKDPQIRGCQLMFAIFGLIIISIYSILASDLLLWIKILLTSGILIITYILVNGLCITLKAEETHTKYENAILATAGWILNIIIWGMSICFVLCVISVFLFLIIKWVLSLFGIDIYTLIHF